MTVALKFNKPQFCPQKPADELVLPYAKVGVEVEIEGFDGSRNVLTKWESHEDGSLRRGREFTTRGGLVGEELIQEIETITKYCKEKKFSEGYPRAGIHLHVDMTDMNDGSDTQMLHMLMAYMLFEDAVFGFAGEWRKACGFCEPWLVSQTGLKPLAKLLMNWSTAPAETIGSLEKYQAVNFLPLFAYGTVEFRHLPTTFDSARIITWINICLAFKRWGKEIDRNPIEVLDARGVKPLARALFGKTYDSIAPYIRNADVYKAAVDVAGMHLLQGRATTIGMSWDAHDNPLLALKKNTSAAKGAAQAPLEPEERPVPAARRARVPLLRAQREDDIPPTADFHGEELIRLVNEMRRDNAGRAE